VKACCCNCQCFTVSVICFWRSSQRFVDWFIRLETFFEGITYTSSGMYIYKKISRWTDIVDIPDQFVDDTIILQIFTIPPISLVYRIFVSCFFFKLVQIIAASGPSPHLPSDKTWRYFNNTGELKFKLEAFLLLIVYFEEKATCCNCQCFTASVIYFWGVD
jgi:hypothetical protein